MQLTKTDFIQFLNCPNSLWLLKNKPDVFAEYKSEFSLFLEKLVREGYEVEEYVMKLYPDVIDLEHCSSGDVKEKLKEAGFYSQATLTTTEGLFARLDLIEVLQDGTIDIYEIKSSTSVKKDKKHNHLKDIAFQKYVVEQNNFTVNDVIHTHLNKEFIKSGEIDIRELIVFENVNEAVAEVFDQTVEEIKACLEHINRDSLNEDVCTCLDTTRSNHCDTFKYFNKNIPEHSIYELNNIRDKKIQTLRDDDIYKISDVPEEFKLSEYQQLQQLSVIKETPIIDWDNIGKTLDELQFPLYFFDYETLPFAVPRVNGYKPHQHTPIQYSLHILNENGDLDHFEYLAESLEEPQKLIESMRGHIGSKGTLVSWYASFEKTRNKEMAELYPEHRGFLENINNRTFDLMDIFKRDYVDAQFLGSQSIKKVQPVLVPNLSYKTLDVQSGTMAVDSAERLYDMTDLNEIKNLRNAMLEYCKLDTLAMVKIWEVLNTGCRTL
jgi:hypothetical protein